MTANLRRLARRAESRVGARAAGVEIRRWSRDRRGALDAIGPRYGAVPILEGSDAIAALVVPVAAR